MRTLIASSITVTMILCAASFAIADASKGQGVYMNFCASCHANGLAGAPKVGDKATWEKRVAKGEEALAENAIKGFQGETGFMPAKGGMSSLSDEEVTSAVKYMIEQSQ